MYGYQPSTHADRILTLTGVLADGANRLTLVSNICDVVTKSLKLSKERMASMSTRTAPLFQPRDFVYLSIKGYYTSGHKNANIFGSLQSNF